MVFGQELNAESYAICKADMLLKGQDIGNIIFGNTFTQDGHAGKTFDYMLSNPPFGVEWRKVESEVRAEHERRGFAGRFGAGLPGGSDGSLLFLLHSALEDAGREGRRKPHRHRVERLAALYRRGGIGESDIRKWIIENDWLEAIVALPTDMFYNTSIATYIWVLTNHKVPERKGKIQLVNAAEFFQKMRKSLGAKRKELGAGDIDRITPLYGAFEVGDCAKVFDNADFGYRTITVERPLRLNFQVSAVRLERLAAVREIKKLSEGERKALVDALMSLDGERVYRSRPAFLKDLKKALAAHHLALSPAQTKALWQALPNATRRRRRVPMPRASPNRTRSCAIPRTCRSRTTSTPTLPAR